MVMIGGVIREIDNCCIVKIVKLVGVLGCKYVGVCLFVRLGDVVEEG